MSGLLSERAMLASLHISSWSGMQIDREVTDAVNEDFKADKKAGRYNKRLVASQFLEGVTTAHSKARAAHKLLTLPWEDNGKRILATVGYMNYTSVMKDCRLKAEAAVKEFLADPKPYIEEAKVRLGDMFNPDDYPDAAELKEKFGFDVEVTNIPEANDFRAKVSDESMKAIIKDIERRSEQRLENAVKDVFVRVKDVVAVMSKRLKEYTPAKGDTKRNGIIRDSVVYNINEMAEMMHLLNITGDQRIDDLAKQLKAELVEHSPEILRADTKVRQDTIKKADAILKKVGVYLK